MASPNAGQGGGGGVGTRKRQGAGEGGGGAWKLQVFLLFCWGRDDPSDKPDGAEERRKLESKALKLWEGAGYSDGAGLSHHFHCNRREGLSV